MATTKIISIRVTETNALTYIANPDKTDNGRLIHTFGCNKNPVQASRDFEQVRAMGTGRNQILSHHFIQSFAPNEITPEDGRTFETHVDQGDKQHRKWVNLRNLSDEICRKHCLSVIENPENNKGKTYYEWDMNRKGLSWKAKLKFAIDQVIKESDNFEDFLRRCKAKNIEAVYNPEHVIDLKFRLVGQQKFTRSRTLGWYYETKQIIKRIELYKGIFRTSEKSNYIDTLTQKMEDSPALQH